MGETVETKVAEQAGAATAPPVPEKKKKGKGRFGGRSGMIFYCTMIALPVLQFVIFYIVVNFNSFMLAFQTYDRGYRFEGFVNFERIFYNLTHGTQITSALTNSVMYFGLNLLVLMPLTLMFSYYIFKKSFLGRFFKVMLFVPGMISSIVLVLLFKYFMDEGWPILVGLPASQPPPLADPNSRRSVLVVYNLLFGFSSTILLYLNAISSVSDSVLEAAAIDGAGEFRTFFKIVIPMIWQTLVSFIVINMAAIATNQAELFSFFGINADPSVQTFGYYQFILIMSGDAKDPTSYPYAAAVGMLMTLLIAPLTMLVRWLLVKYGPKEE